MNPCCNVHSYSSECDPNYNNAIKKVELALPKEKNVIDKLKQLNESRLLDSVSYSGDGFWDKDGRFLEKFKPLIPLFKYKVTYRGRGGIKKWLF